MEEKQIIENHQIVEKMGKLILALQEEVKNLKEDTCVNALVLKEMKENHSQAIKLSNKNTQQLKNEVLNFSGGLEEAINEKGLDNYSEFLKSLLKNDFNAKLNEELELLKREIAKNDKGKKSSSEIEIPFIFKAGAILGILSGVFCIFLIVKFNLF